MKRIMLSLVAMLCISMAAQAQVTSMGLYNNTSYTLTFKLHIDVGPTNVCGSVVTHTLTLGPGASIGFPDPSFVSGSFSSTDLFQAVQVYTNPTCGATAMVYQCPATNNYTSPSLIHDAACNPIGSITANWLIQPGSAAVVQVN